MLLLSCTISCEYTNNNKKEAQHFYKLGCKALKENDVNKAIIYFKNSINKNPNYKYAYYKLALAYTKKNKVDLAINTLETILSNQPDFLDAKILLGKLYYNTGRYDEVIPLYRDVLNKKVDPSIMVILADSLLNIHSIDEAKKILQQAIQKYPNRYRIRLYLAKAYYLEGNVKKAKTIVKDIKKKYPLDLKAQIIIADFYNNIGMLKEAENILLSLIKKFPKDPHPYISALLFYLHHNELNKALRVVNTASINKIENAELFYLAGIIFHLKKEPNMALFYFRAAAEKDPNNINNLLALAAYYKYMRDYDDAEKVYKKIIDKFPELNDIKSRLISLLLIKGDLKEAQREINILLKNYPSYANAYILKGILWHEKGKLNKAISNFLKAKELKPSYAPSRFYYGLAMLEKGDINISLSEILMALRKSPDNYLYHYALGYIYYITNEYTKAENEIKWVLSHVGGSIKTRLFLAVVYIKDRKYKEAIHTLLNILSKKCNNHRQSKLCNTACIQLIKVYLLNKQPNKALNICNKYLNNEKKNMIIPFINAHILINKGEYENAIKILLSFAYNHPQNFYAFVLLGDIYFIKHDYANALKYYKKAIKIYPKDINLLLKIAQIYRLHKRYDLAIKIYKTILKFKPNCVAAANNLAYIYLITNKDLDNALFFAKMALQIAPQDPHVLDTVGCIYLKKGGVFLAKKYIGMAIINDNNNPIFHYHMANVLIKEGRINEAKKEIIFALKNGLSGKDRDKAKALLMEIKGHENRENFTTSCISYIST